MSCLLTRDSYKNWNGNYWYHAYTLIVPSDYLVLNPFSGQAVLREDYSLFCDTPSFCHDLSSEGACHKPIGTTAPPHLSERLLPYMFLVKGWGRKIRGISLWNPCCKPPPPWVEIVGNWYLSWSASQPPPPTKGENIKIGSPPYGFSWIRHWKLHGKVKEDERRRKKKKEERKKEEEEEEEEDISV